MLQRRSRLSQCSNLVVLVVSAYLVLGSLLVTNSVTREVPKLRQLPRIAKNKRMPTLSGLDLVVENSAANADNRAHRLRAVQSVELARNSYDKQTAETVTESLFLSSSSNENITDNAAAGYERVDRTFRQGDVERTVRRLVTRFRTRPPRKVHYSSGNWQV